MLLSQVAADGGGGVHAAHAAPALHSAPLIPDLTRALLLLLLLPLLQVAADGGGGGYTQHMRNLNWEFAVINQPDVNAFVVPGGKVVVYTGKGCFPHPTAICTLLGWRCIKPCVLVIQESASVAQQHVVLLPCCRRFCPRLSTPCAHPGVDTSANYANSANDTSAAGLLRLMQTEDELAAVLAHEVSRMSYFQCQRCQHHAVSVTLH
jgi:hypothetical protein